VSDRKIYTAEAWPEDEVWIIKVPAIEHGACVTEAATPEEIEPMARDFIAVMCDVEPDSFILEIVTPKYPPAKDGIYPRCVWCGGKNYVLGVLHYSRGEAACAAVSGCGRMLPDSYRAKD
jgi:predicted RNase H-like HicB family nuclease